MPSFSKPEQALVNRRRFLAGIAAACIPASAGDGIALNSISHPEVTPVAAQQIWIGDIVKYVNGNIAHITGLGDVAVGVAIENAQAGQPVRVLSSDELLPIWHDDPIGSASRHIKSVIDTEITIEDQHDSARQNANGLRIHRRRLDRAAAAVLQV